MDSYFLPPVVKKLPPWERTPEIRSPRYRHFLWFWRGTDVLIAGVTYRGAYWNGPLTSAQITAITAAGYGTRIYAVNNLIELPANIPEDIA